MIFAIKRKRRGNYKKYGVEVLSSSKEGSNLLGGLCSLYYLRDTQLPVKNQLYKGRGED